MRKPRCDPIDDSRVTGIGRRTTRMLVEIGEVMQMDGSILAKKVEDEVSAHSSRRPCSEAPALREGMCVTCEITVVSARVQTIAATSTLRQEPLPAFCWRRKLPSRQLGSGESRRLGKTAGQRWVAGDGAKLKRKLLDNAQLLFLKGTAGAL